MFKIKGEKDCVKKRKGMTLIEVVIVIAIVGIMSSVSIVSYITAKRNAELETAAEEVVSVLREAQNYALTGKELTSSACATYTVSFSAGSGNFTLRNGGGACGLNETYSLKNGVTVLTAGNTSFTAPHASVGAATRTVIQKGGEYYTICTNTVGLIRKLVNNVVCP